MTKLTRRMRMIREKVNIAKQYHIDEALILLKTITTTNFIESVDIAITLNIDTRKSEQNIRGTIVLPHGTGRSIKVAVFTQGSNAEDAISAGADMVGMQDLAECIVKGEKIDIIIASPDAMHVVNPLGQFLGPRGLMPNLKIGTITSDIYRAVKNAKYGQICYKNDKNGIIHTTIGKIDFELNQLKNNLNTLLIALKKAKPISVKGVFVNKISISTTMSIGIAIDQTSINNIYK